MFRYKYKSIQLTKFENCFTADSFGEDAENKYLGLLIPYPNKIQPRINNCRLQCT